MVIGRMDAELLEGRYRRIRTFLEAEGLGPYEHHNE